MGRSDEQLVEACLGGEVGAFDILVDRWQRKIRGAVYRVVRSEEEAQDICQEAFLRAFRGLPSFKRESRFSSWLYQIALNLSRDRLRRRKTRNWVSLDDLDEASPVGSQRAPSEAERKAAEAFVAKQTSTAGSQESAMSELARSLLNLNEFLYVD